MASVLSRVDTSHKDVIHDAQLNYYGTRLATCSSDRMIKIFEVKPSGQSYSLAELAGHSGPVWQLSWAHPKYDNVLASAGYDKKVIIWQETDGKWHKSFEYTGHEASVNSISFAPHQYGLILASGSADGNVTILTFDAQTSNWDAKKIPQAHEQGVNSVSWAPAVHVSPDANGAIPPQKRIVTCGNDKIIKIWICDENGEWILEKGLLAHTEFVRDVAWCPVVNGTTHTIASVGQDRSLFLWRCKSIGESEWTFNQLEKADGALWHVSWSLCGSILAVSGEDNKVVLWRENLANQWERIEQNQENATNA